MPEQPLRTVDLAATDALLREDVNMLGTLVGEILAEQRTPDFLAEVERLRRAAIRRRESNAPVAELAQALQGIDLDHANDLVRAFATYFQAVNLAERVHRIRRRRDYERQGAAPQPEGLRDAIATLAAQGVAGEEVAALLPRLHIEPVFTAHPTEAVRRALLRKEREIVACLIDDIDRSRTPAERRIDRERIRVALTTSWQTAEAPAAKPSVADEFRHVGYYLCEVLYRVLPVFYEAFEDALREHYGEVAVPHVLGFGSWVGGDMDGNPNVGADTITATLAGQRALVLAAHRRELAALGEILSQSLLRVDVSPALRAHLDSYRARLPQAATKLHPRHADMPYRNLLTLMRERLRATAHEAPEGYAAAAEFEADVALIEDSLRAHRGAHAGAFAVRRLRRRVAGFGFHLASLDLRQNSAAHDAALAALLADPHWPARSVAERTATLHRVLRGEPAVPAPDAAEAQATLEVFRAVAAARPRYGEYAFGPYIISMSRSAADALAVLALARAAGCVEPVAGAGGAHPAVPLDIAPLFETVDDLEAAEATLRALFADPLYREHLAARGNRQVVMLGYSDSAKDGGLIASRWALQQTQVALTRLARDSGVQIALFHGRGGSTTRGGGKTGRWVIAAPRGSTDGYLRVTEQGEVIHRKYGIRAIALRNLEQATAAVLRATLRPRPAEPREQRWRAIATGIAAEARTHYRALVHENAAFIPYFRAATPIDVIERLRIGSRPSRRGGGPDDTGIDALRAIPWVFAWAQNRSGLTAWYGCGAALERALQRHGAEAIAEMARDWPFFSALVDDVELMLAKSDLGIFERYSLLAGDLHARFHPAIAAEFARTREAVLTIKRSGELLAGDQRLRESIRLRNPYIDPISMLQVDLLTRWRAGGCRDQALLRSLIATVNGIAAGIQSTG